MKGHIVSLWIYCEKTIIIVIIIITIIIIIIILVGSRSLLFEP